MSNKNDKPSKAHHVFPAPEWTSLSAQLAASLAHEIRNPLLSIKGAAQLLEGSVSEDDKTLAQLIITEAQRIEQLVATLDPLTPDPSQITQALNIHEVTEYVRRAASPYAGNVKISTQYDPSLPDVAGVREALIQAFINLVKNAVEAVSVYNPVGAGNAGGKPSPLAGEGLDEGASIDTPNVTNPSPLKQGISPVSASPAGGEGELVAPFVPSVVIATRYLLGEHMQRKDGAKLHLQVSVTDNGPGVAEDVVGRLFTPFSSTKENGKGLGLAIVAKIVEEHGGLIAYDVPANGGARFSIYLPVA